jgi:hypothetical protein
MSVNMQQMYFVVCLVKNDFSKKHPLISGKVYLTGY